MKNSFYLKQVETGPLANFVYLVGSKQEKEVFIVDPAWQMNAVLKIAEEEKLKIVGALITHSHYDHCNGIDDLFSQSELPVYVQKKEIEFLKSHKNPDGLFWKLPENQVKGVEHNSRINIGNLEITFLHTPGHTPGSQCILVQNHLISGDTLFIRGCGRCDLPGGNVKEMHDSLTRLMTLPDDTMVLPGHRTDGAIFSTIEREKKENPFFKCGSYASFEKLFQ